MTVCRAVWASLLAVLLASVGLAFGSAPALAVVTHPFLGSFDGSGTPSGRFFAPGRVTVDQGSGDVYVVDVNGAAVEVLDSAGNFLREITGAGTPAGSFTFSPIGSSAVAVDASGGLSDGDVYVADTRNDVVDVFDSMGAYERALTGMVAPTGVTVDQNGHVWVAESGDGATDSGMVHEFDSAGNLLQSWPNHYFSTEAIAVDSDSRVYLINGAGEVTRWTSAGGDETLITPDATAIAVGPADDHLHVLKRQFVTELDAAGDPVGDFGSGPLNNSYGIAIHGASGKVFATNSIPPRQVSIFGPLATVPDVTTGPATGITTTAATLHGTINAQGLGTTYQFEWGPDESYGNVAPLDPGDAGDGTDDVEVTADLTGLTPGTTYHYRLEATNDEATGTGQDGAFTTESPPQLPPSIASQSVSDVGETVATLRATIDARGLATIFQFEYGTTDAYGAVSPVVPLSLPALQGNRGVATQLTRLAPGTTYHYRITAFNVAGATTGPDHTFTTASTPCTGLGCPGAAPPAGGGPAGGEEPPDQPADQLEVAALTTRQLARWARTGVLKLKVRVGARGRVRARALARLPGSFEATTVARGSATAEAAGVVTLTLRLSRAARDALEDGRLTVRIVITGADRTATRRVTLKRTAG